MNRRRLAITGATGYLGRHFAAEALQRGYALHVLARGPIPENLRLPGIRTFSELTAAFFEEAEAVVHLAACGVRGSTRVWEEMLEANVLLPQRLAQAATASGIRHFVMTGTALEYAGFGRLPEAPWREAPMPLCSETAALGAEAYGATKAAGHLLARAAMNRSEAGGWYLRLASLLGPDDYPEKIAPAALAHARKALPLEMTAGDQVRDWLWISDAIDAIWRALETPPPPGDLEVVNIGTGEGITLRGLTERLYVAAGADPSLIRAGARPYRGGEPHVLVLDPTLAGQRLGWSPATPIAAAVQRLAAEESR